MKEYYDKGSINYKVLSEYGIDPIPLTTKQFAIDYNSMEISSSIGLILPIIMCEVFKSEEYRKELKDIPLKIMCFEIIEFTGMNVPDGCMRVPDSLEIFSLDDEFLALEPFPYLHN